MESNSLKGVCIKTVHSIEFKFGMHIIGHRRTKTFVFVEFPMHSFLREYKKKNLYITAYGVKFFKSFQFLNDTIYLTQI